MRIFHFFIRSGSDVFQMHFITKKLAFVKVLNKNPTKVKVVLSINSFRQDYKKIRLKKFCLRRIKKHKMFQISGSGSADQKFSSLHLYNFENLIEKNPFEV